MFLKLTQKVVLEAAAVFTVRTLIRVIQLL